MKWYIQFFLGLFLTSILFSKLQHENFEQFSVRFLSVSILSWFLCLIIVAFTGGKKHE